VGIVKLRKSPPDTESCIGLVESGSYSAVHPGCLQEATPQYHKAHQTPIGLLNDGMITGAAFDSCPLLALYSRPEKKDLVFPCRAAKFENKCTDSVGN